MRSKRFCKAILTALALCLSVLPQAQAKSHKATASKSHVHKATGHTVKSSAKAKRGRHSRYSARAAAPAKSWRNRQLAPTSDRYREIQEALASKGYLKSTPNGAWDSESQDALKRFQADQHIEQTGKLNSLSLIALGLGPSKTEPPASAPAVPQQ